MALIYTVNEFILRPTLGGTVIQTNQHTATRPTKSQTKCYSQQMKSYKHLESVFKQIENLNHAAAILQWDEAAMMPQGGGDARAEALTEIVKIKNQILIDPALLEHFTEAQSENLEEDQKIDLREMGREIKRVHQVDPALTALQTRERFRCEQAWRTLRAQNNWDEFLPYLEKIVELSREEARQRARELSCSPYDALIEQMDTGGSAEYYQKMFEPLRQELPQILEQAQIKQKQFITPQGPFAIETQKTIGLEVMKFLGFDFNHGRLDVSLHPFCGGVSQDVRMTTRYKTDDFSESLMGIIHETGHGVYEQNLPKQFVGFGHAMGMSIHESQSLFFEMQVGRSQSFAKFLSPLLQKHFSGPGLDVENLYALSTRVKPGFIRVAADEVTYPFHILLRFELEQALFSGDLECKDLPDQWDQKMKGYLNLSTTNNYRDGVMQDVHWPAGLFGYFPSYTIGAMIAAQLAHWLLDKKELEAGGFQNTGAALKQKIWSQGRRYSAQQLIANATGEQLNPKYFLDHLRQRFT